MNTKLTPEQKLEIKDAYEDRTMRVEDIANAYKITRGHVVKIALAEGATYRRPKSTVEMKKKKTK